MTLDEFRKHPAYDYYIRTLVSNCLVCDLETKFDNQYTILAILSAYYHIDWKECRCLKGVKLEDVTPELEQKAFKEMK